MSNTNYQNPRSPFQDFTLGIGNMTIDGLKKLKTSLWVISIIGIIVGILFIFQQEFSVVFLGILGAIGFIVMGVVYIYLAFSRKDLSGWGRVGYGLLGVLFIIAGIIGFTSPDTVTVALTIVIGIAWIVQGIMAFVYMKESPSKGWSIFFGIISILAGLLLMFSPIAGTISLLLVTGIMLIILSIVGIVDAFQLGSKEKHLKQAMNGGSPSN